jgi:hypothetical protein
MKRVSALCEVIPGDSDIVHMNVSLQQLQEVPQNLNNWTKFKGFVRKLLEGKPGGGTRKKKKKNYIKVDG